jgi:hypothetical protein
LPLVLYGCEKSSLTFRALRKDLNYKDLKRKCSGKYLDLWWMM